MREKITAITLDCMLGIREGVGKCRVDEFSDYLKDLIRAKAKGLDVTVLQFPMLSDRVKQGIEAGLSAKSNANVEGGIEWKFITAAGSSSSETQQGIRVKIDMEFMSVGAPDFEKIQLLSVEDLKTLLEVVNAE